MPQTIEKVSEKGGKIFTNLWLFHVFFWGGLRSAAVARVFLIAVVYGGLGVGAKLSRYCVERETKCP